MTNRDRPSMPQGYGIAKARAGGMLDSMKGRNMARNPAIVVHLESGDDVVILEGTAEQVTDPALLGRFIDAYDTKYGFRLDSSDLTYGVYALRPKVTMAWLEQDFPNTATRWRFNS